MVFVPCFNGYKVCYTHNAQKSLQSIDKMYAIKIEERLNDMVHGLPNVDVKRLQGEDQLFRLRVGMYRAVFEVHKDIITILVVAIDHRRDAYK